MNAKFRFLVSFLVLFALGARAQGAGPLRLLQTVPLPGVHGRIDHFDADLDSHRLFMSALGNNTLEVFDLRAHRVIRSIHGLHEPQGVTYSPESRLIFVANGGDGTCRIFDGRTYRLLKTVRLSSDADDTRYDPATKRVFVGYGDAGHAGLAVFDGATGELLETIPLPAHPESFQLEESGPRIFVNIPSAGNIIAVIDRAQGKIVATWKLSPAAENFPMALDEKDHRLFVTCRNPAEVLILDTATGKLLARVPCVTHADDMWFDAAHHRIYVSGGGGFLTVVEAANAARYRVLAQVRTQLGGRTSWLNPAANRLYLGLWAQGGGADALQVYGILP